MTYIGRIDDQIKIRGHRVELGEIEVVLADHPGVARAVVVYEREDGGRLRAVLRLREEVDLADIEKHAARQLPTWMRPSDYTVVDSIPLTVGGKADRAALINRLRSAGPGTADAEYREDPTVDVTEDVRAVWCEVLRIEAIADEDDFFEIGGHSLTAMQVATRLRSKLNGTKVPTRMLFTYPKFGAFAGAVNERANAAQPGEVTA
jgi:aryl carrier-like protein